MPADDNIKNDIRYNLNTSGSHYVKVTFTNQTWLRLNGNNPGTTYTNKLSEATESGSLISNFKNNWFELKGKVQTCEQ